MYSPQYQQFPNPLYQRTSASAASSPTSAPNRTYDSLYRHHSSGTGASSRLNAMLAQSPHPPTRPPQLAPPADILSPRRRVHQDGQALQINPYAPTQPPYSPSTIPATPPPLPRHGAATKRTPSQTAASREADAVETLMFMASPGNSGYAARAEHSLQTSPLRSHFLPSEKSPVHDHGYGRGGRNGRLSSEEADPVSVKKEEGEGRRLGFRKAKVPRNVMTAEQDIDAALDRVGSSGEETEEDGGF